MTDSHLAEDADFVRATDAVVGKILASEDFDQVLAWLRDSEVIHDILPPGQTTPETLRAVSALFARSIWNATPLPGNRFRPRPLPRPQRNDPCLCGSGLKYKRCCSHFPMPDIDPEEIWLLAMSHLDDAQLTQALNVHAVPPAALAEIARERLEERHAGKARNLLEPLFAGDLRALDERYHPALDVLCDAYSELNHHQKKHAFLERVIREAGPAMRAAAWQRLAAMRMDDGDTQGAWEAFRRAQRERPNEPTHAMLEIPLLMAEGRGLEAQQRARFWLGKLEHDPRVAPETLDFLEAVSEDADRAMLAMNGDPQLERLAEYISAAADRELPDYRLSNVADSEPGEDESASFRETLPDLGIDDDAQDARKQMHLDLDDTEDEFDDALDGADAELDDFQILEPGPTIRQLERDWYAHLPDDDALDVDDDSFGDADEWEPSVTEQWLSWLERNPAAMDSFDIIDDLVNVLDNHPGAGSLGFDQTCLAPLLERSAAMIEHALSQLPPDTRLHWHSMDNRPVLRLLLRYMEYLEHKGEHEAAHQWRERYLTLNPEDNHAIRAQHVNALLRAGKNQEALALCARYPDDVLIEIPLGATLAHYRLGEKTAAAQTLAKAHATNKHVLGMLRRARVRRPEINEYGITLGGEDQAYVYWAEMHDVWARETGLLDWVRRQIR